MSRYRTTRLARSSYRPSRRASTRTRYASGRALTRRRTGGRRVTVTTERNPMMLKQTGNTM